MSIPLRRRPSWTRSSASAKSTAPICAAPRRAPASAAAPVRRAPARAPGGPPPVAVVARAGPRHARRAPRHRAQVDVRGEGELAGVDLEDGLAPPEVGAVDDHLPVEAARPEERGV